jgi:pimeloyl-ACP methyl ester carboxylesterase
VGSRVVVALLDTLGLERVDVLGYSFGGGLAQELRGRGDASRATGRPAHHERSKLSPFVSISA